MLEEGNDVESRRGDDDICTRFSGKYHQQNSRWFDTGESRTSSLDVEISLVELGNELGELGEITVH